MSIESELQDTERRTYLAYFNDGIADIAAGLVPLSFGLGMVFEESLFFIFTWLPLILLWPLKRAITSARMGHVKFRPARRRKISRNLILLLVAGVISALLAIVAFLGLEGEVINLRDFMLQYGDLVVGVVMTTPFALIALLFEVGRFYGYSALIIGGWVLPYLVEVQSGLPVIVAGGTIALIGLGLLTRFLVNNPLPSE